MARKILNTCLLCSSLVGYLEWGTDQGGFLFLLEWEVFAKGFQHPMEVLHPFTILPLIGQLLLLVTLFQKTPSKLLSLTGLIFLSLLLLLISFIGVLDFNLKIFASTIPFLVSFVLSILLYFKNKTKNI
jgi:hypothetical protein